MTEKELLLRIKAVSDAAGFDKVKGHLKDLGGLAADAGKVMAVGFAAGTAAIAGLGVAAVSAAADFQAQMKQVETLGADFGRPFQEVEADVSKLATTMGIDAVDAATTLYNAVSAGVPAGNALEFMEAAATAAVGGAAELSAVGSAMSVAMNSWGESAGTATDITDGLFQVVKMGVTTIPEMAANLGQASGIAAAAGVSFNEYGAALAQITTKGKTTSVASTQLKGILSEIMTPTSKATAAFKELGYANGQAAIDALGFQGAMQALEQKATSMGQPITALFGSVEAGGAALDLTGSNTDAFSAKLAGMEQAAGNSQAALDKVNEGFTRQFDLLKSQGAGVLRDIGMALLPAVTDALSGVNDHLSFFTDAWKSAQEEGAGPFEAALRALSDTLDSLGFEGLAQTLTDLQVEWGLVVAAFENGGIQAALEEIVGFDLQPLIDAFLLLKDGALALWNEAIVPLGGAVLELGGFIAEHADLVIGAAAAYGTFRLALAVQAGIAAVGKALTTAKAAWALWTAGSRMAALQTLGFSTAVKIALGPVGWLIAAVGLLAAAWSGNWGGIREKTAAVVDWLKGVPAMLAGAWSALVAGVQQFAANFVAGWRSLSDGAKTAIKVLLALFFPLPLLFTDSGRQMVAGLWNGIKAGWDRMVGWVKEKAQGLIKSVKGVFGIQSPSRVFYDIGRWLMEGLSLGLVAGGTWVVRSAEQVAREVIAAFWSAKAAAEAGQAIAAAAKAAVDAALAADGVIQGKRETASEAWGRYYDEMSRREDDLHKQKMADLEALDKAEREQHEAAKTRAVEFIELQKRRIEGLLQQQREAEAKSGGGSGPGGPPALKGFDDELEGIEAKLRPILEMLGFTGDDALEDWWRAFHDGGQRAIETAEELADALGELATVVGERYDEIGRELEAAQADRTKGEVERHETVMRLLNERRAIIEALIAAQTAAEEDLADLIAERDRLLRLAEETIKDAQDAAEEREERIHDGIMARIAERRAADEHASALRMGALEDERERIELAHTRRLSQIQTERDAITEGFEERERQIDTMRTDLDQLKLDLGVDRAAEDLAMLKDKLNDFKSLLDSFKPVTRGREALDERRRAQTERTRITTDDQRRAFEELLSMGVLTAEDQRRVQLLLLGRGTQKVEDVKRILGILGDGLEAQVNAQQAVVDANAAAIKAKQDEIDLAETLLKIDRDRAVEKLADLDKQIKAEEDRYKAELFAINTRIELEKSWHDAQMDYYDQLEKAEEQRHAKRMSDIAAEYALELAKLGMTQEQIDAMVAEAQRIAAEIAAETEAIFNQLRGGTGGAAEGTARSFESGARQFSVAIASPGAASLASGMRVFASSVDRAQTAPAWITMMSDTAQTFGSTVASAIVNSAPKWAAEIQKSMRPPKPRGTHGAEDDDFWRDNAYGDMRHHHAARQRYLRDVAEWQELMKPEALPPPRIMDPGAGVSGDAPRMLPGTPIHLDGEVTAATASIDSAELGDFVVNGMSVSVRLPSGRELAAETVDVLVQDVALLDKLGARLNERAARTGQIRRGTP